MAQPPSFPTLPGIMFPVRRVGPIFNTVVQTAISNKQTAFAKRTTPSWRWELPFEFLRSGITDGSGTVFDEFQQLAGFYAGRYGRLLTFGYKDVKDNTATLQGFGLGTGVATDFQLVRTFGGFTEPVFLANVTTIYADGTPLVAGTDYTVSDKGKVTFTAAPASGALLTWTGTFNWLCRFDDEGLEFDNFLKDYWSIEKVSFSSLVP